MCHAPGEEQGKMKDGVGGLNGWRANACVQYVYQERDEMSWD